MPVPLLPRISQRPRIPTRTPRGWADLLLLRRSGAATLSPVASVLWAWLWAVVVGLVSSAVLAAMIAADTGATLIDPARLAPTLWRVAHQVPVPIDEGSVSLLPLSLTLGVIAVVGLVVRWLWLSVRHLGTAMALAAVTAVVTAYMLVTMVVATASAGAAAEGSESALLPMVVVVLIGAGAGLVAAVGTGRGRLSGVVAAVAAIIAAWIAVGAALVAFALITNFDAVVGGSADLLSAQTGNSIVPATLLGLLQLGYLPNLVLWASAYALGTGVELGADTVVSPSLVRVGLTPDLPMLNALPADALPWPLLLPLTAAVIAGTCGTILTRRGVVARTLSTRLMTAAIVTAGVAVVVGMLVAASSGGLGDGRLAFVGPPVGAAMLHAAGVAGLGLLVWALGPTLASDLRPHVRAARRGLRRRR